jgi:hypothetical protein
MAKGKGSWIQARQAPSTSANRPPPKIDPEQMKQFQTCVCSNKQVLDSIQNCVPKECGDQGTDSTPIFNMYNRMCKSVDNFKPLQAPPPPAGAPPPPAAAAPPAPKAPKAPKGPAAPTAMAGGH